MTTLILTKVVLILIIIAYTFKLLELFVDNLNKYMGEFFSEKHKDELTAIATILVTLYSGSIYIDITK